MGRKGGKAQKRWALYGELHNEVAAKIAENGIYLDFNYNDDENCQKDYDTNIMGRFFCRNQGCENEGWTSKKIAITIRLYRGGRYNARVYYQRCKRCNCLSKPLLDFSYADRVAYRLKKWHDVKVDKPDTGPREGPPHARELCEGCKAGHCKGF
ncbi:hypothetical protein XA68_12653 [Ophiocordyceps unilateralis]|uniref:3CxxC-type domain-containing protein n=1 Tax=Ophiocordyceps unilateralis TaxID=268505 RepID=A0A2A9PE82_OPHUN|nr:hypothetical protein XA68_12653 [Ophiocordyceps unilateralis]